MCVQERAADLLYSFGEEGGGGSGRTPPAFFSPDSRKRGGGEGGAVVVNCVSCRLPPLTLLLYSVRSGSS